MTQKNIMRNFLKISLFIAGTQAERLPCQIPQARRAGPSGPKPDECCGPTKPYNSATKKCCSNEEQTVFSTWNHIEKPTHHCCNGVVYNSLTRDCCNNEVVRKAESECGACHLSDWSEWSGCEVGIDPFAGVFSSREREYKPKPGYTTDDCKSSISSTEELIQSQVTDGLMSLYSEDHTWPRIYVEERPDDEEGSCTEQIGARFLNKFLLSQSKDEPEFRDLLILVDESTSIGAENFEIVKRTLGLMLDNLCEGIGMETNRVAMLRYSSDIKDDFNFLEGTNQQKVLRSIQRLKYKPITDDRHGSTYTAHAMDQALKTIFTADAGWRNGSTEDGIKVRTEVVIITDGESNDPDGTFSIQGQKVKYDEYGIKVYALGVGDIHKDEIRSLTSMDDDSIFYLMSWKDLADFNKIIETLITEHSDVNRCVPFEVMKETKLERAQWIEEKVTQHDPEFPIHSKSLDEIVNLSRAKFREEQKEANRLARRLLIRQMSTDYDDDELEDLDDLSDFMSLTGRQ